MTQEQVVSLLSIVLPIIITSVVSAVAGGVAIAVVIHRALKDLHESPVIMHALELLFSSLPPETTSDIHEAADIVADATDEKQG